jgi:hypothetical protein
MVLLEPLLNGRAKIVKQWTTNGESVAACGIKVKP